MIHETPLQFARRRHRFQRYGGGPYESHLIRVKEILVEFGFDDFRWCAAGLLHDTIEDTGTTRGEIEERFDSSIWSGPLVSELVWAATGIGATRRERQNDIRRKLRTFPEACPLKVADRIANVEASLASDGKAFARMYLAEAEQFDEIASADTVPSAMRSRLVVAYCLARAKVAASPVPARPVSAKADSDALACAAP